MEEIKPSPSRDGGGVGVLSRGSDSSKRTSIQTTM